MRDVGALLVGAGTIGGVLSAAPTPESGTGFAASVFVLAAGLWLGRGARGRSAGAGTGVAAAASPVLADLEEALGASRRLAADCGRLPRVELITELDALVTGPFFRLAAGAGTTPGAAAISAAVAVAERKIRRCWSAAVDDARTEIVAVLPAAVAALEDARRVALAQDGREANS